MGKIWLSSDLHFCHDREFLYRARGFNSIWEMNTFVVEAWNKLVDVNDDVYVLGDLMLNDNAEGAKLIKSLNGRLHIVLGNHDTENRVELYRTLPNVVEVERLIMLKYKKVSCVLSHYPMLVGNFDDGRSLHHGLLNLCGHTHTSDPFADWCERGRIYHCELDAHDCKPVLLDEILEKCEEKLKNGT